MGYKAHNSNQAVWWKVAIVRSNFSPFVVEFLNTTNMFKNTEDGKPEEIFVSILLKVLQGDAARPMSL